MMGSKLRIINRRVFGSRLFFFKINITMDKDDKKNTRLFQFASLFLLFYNLHVYEKNFIIV